MSLIEVFLIGVGLSMDAFAVSVCKGLGMEKLSKKNMIIIGIFFGGFQALMPLIGWALGSSFASYIVAFDHWIAFILLVLIGGKMLVDVYKERGEEEEIEVVDKLNMKEMTMLAIATSIDALAVGISMAFLEVDILSAIAMIGCTTFVLSCVGVVMGNFFGSKYKSKAEIAGGIILIFIGCKILFEHMGWLVF